MPNDQPSQEPHDVRSASANNGAAETNEFESEKLKNIEKSAERLLSSQTPVTQSTTSPGSRGHAWTLIHEDVVRNRDKIEALERGVSAQISTAVSAHSEDKQGQYNEFKADLISKIDYMISASVERTVADRISGHLSSLKSQVTGQLRLNNDKLGQLIKHAARDEAIDVFSSESKSLQERLDTSDRSRNELIQERFSFQDKILKEKFVSVQFMKWMIGIPFAAIPIMFAGLAFFGFNRYVEVGMQMEEMKSMTADAEAKLFEAKVVADTYHAGVVADFDATFATVFGSLQYRLTDEELFAQQRLVEATGRKLSRLLSSLAEAPTLPLIDRQYTGSPHLTAIHGFKADVEQFKSVNNGFDKWLAMLRVRRQGADSLKQIEAIDAMEQAWREVFAGTKDEQGNIGSFDKQMMDFAKYATAQAVFRRYKTTSGPVRLLNDAKELFRAAQRSTNIFSVAVGSEALVYQEMFTYSLKEVDPEDFNPEDSSSRYHELHELINIAIEKGRLAVADETQDARVLAVSYNNLGNSRLLLSRLQLSVGKIESAVNVLEKAKDNLEHSLRHEADSSFALFTTAEVEALLLTCRHDKEPTQEDFTAIAKLLQESFRNLKDQDMFLKKIFESRQSVIELFPELNVKYPAWTSVLPEQFDNVRVQD